MLSWTTLGAAAQAGLIATADADINMPLIYFARCWAQIYSIPRSFTLYNGAGPRFQSKLNAYFSATISFSFGRAAVASN